MDTPKKAIVPPVIYLPVQADAELGHLALRRNLADGRVGLIAFTALDRLIDACGERQAWVCVQISETEDIRARTPFDVVVLDPDVPVSAVREGRLA